MNIVLKYLLTSLVVVLVSELAKRNDRVGGLVAALPMVTVLTLCWLHIENQPVQKISNHAWFTLWYVIPTLPMFALFPLTLTRIGFWPSLALSAVVTVVALLLFAKFMLLFNVRLL